MSYSIFHRNKEIVFSIDRRNRKSITIQVHPDQRVRVLAPRYSTYRSIVRLVSERAEWILKKQTEFSERQAPTRPHEYRSGELFSYLGKQYSFKLSTGTPGVHIEDGNIIMTAPSSYTSEQYKKLMQNWYKERSVEIFDDRMELCLKKVKVIGIKTLPEWHSRVMKRSWGSCTGKNKIHLNQSLAAAPLDCIDYVILHELCHLVEHNHSQRYYKLLTTVCPDWKSKRDKLNGGYNPALM